MTLARPAATVRMRLPLTPLAVLFADLLLLLVVQTTLAMRALVLAVAAMALMTTALTAEAAGRTSKPRHASSSSGFAHADSALQNEGGDEEEGDTEPPALQRQLSYSVLSKEEGTSAPVILPAISWFACAVLKMQFDLLDEIDDVLGVPTSEAGVLMRHYRYSPPSSRLGSLSAVPASCSQLPQGQALQRLVR